MADGAMMDFSQRRNRSFTELLVKGFLLACALFTVAATVGIIGILLYESWQFFRQIPVSDFLFGTQWTALFGADRQFGVLPLVSGTVSIALISAFISLPLGLMAAIYLSEYARPGLRSVVKPVLEILAGIPTIVFGFFALSFISPNLLAPILPVGTYNALAAGIAVGIMTLPMVASLSEDAIRAVPRSLREASFGLGATRFETATRVVLPAALSGVLASFILALSRAVGETMIVTLAAGSAPAGQTAQSDGMFDIFHSMQTMTGFIAQAFGGDVPQGTVQFYSLFGVGLLLFIMTFSMNLFSQWVARRFREEYE